MHDGRVIRLTARWSRLGRIVALASLGLGSVLGISAASTPRPDPARFFDVDRAVLGGSSDQARDPFDELAARFVRCRNEHPEGDSAGACLRSVVFGGDGLNVVNDSSTVRESTLTGLLLDHRGGCAALVALAMVLDPLAWDAYVLRNHVLLRTRLEPPRYFELTAQGREISVRELKNRFGPQLDSGVVVDAPTFIGYYLDNLAVRLAADGRDDEAERLFRQNVKREPYEARLHLNYGTFLLERGRLDEARKQLKLAVRDAPKSADGWTNLGVAHARLGKIDRARDCFERALKLEPGNQTARTNLAAITSTTNGRTKPQ
jgi:hypothetical protein